MRKMMGKVQKLRECTYNIWSKEGEGTVLYLKETNGEKVT